MFTKSTSAFAKYMVNGWELSGITTLASAHPVTRDHELRAGTGAGGVFPGVTLAYSTLNGSGGWNRVPFLPVGTIEHRPDLQRRCPHYAQPSVRRTRKGQPLV